MCDFAAKHLSVPNLVREAIPALPPDLFLSPDDDLRAAGLTSVGSVSLMLAIEAAYNIAIPDVDLTPANFRSIGAIEALVRRLKSA